MLIVRIVLRGVKDNDSSGPGSSRRRIILSEGQEITTRNKEVFVTKEREACSHPNKLCKTCVPDHLAKGGFDVRTMVVFFFVDYQ